MLCYYGFYCCSSFLSYFVVSRLSAIKKNPRGSFGLAHAKREQTQAEEFINLLNFNLFSFVMLRNASNLEAPRRQKLINDSIKIFNNSI